MAVSYKGNTDFALAQRGEWKVDGWGMDTLPEVWRGRATALDAFLADLNTRRWEEHASYPGMFLSGFSAANTTASFPSVELMYIGFSGDVPPVQKVDGNSLQQAGGEGSYAGTDPETGDPRTYHLTGTILYKAQRTTYTWFETSTPPEESPYNTVTNIISPLENIINYRFVDRDDGKPVYQVPLSGFTDFFNSLTPGVFVNDYTADEVVPLKIWRCTASVDYRLL